MYTLNKCISEYNVPSRLLKVWSRAKTYSIFSTFLYANKFVIPTGSIASHRLKSYKFEFLFVSFIRSRTLVETDHYSH